MRYTPGKYDAYRVAIVVSKKVAKSAPHRNRIRRRLYEVIRLLAPKYLTNRDVVVTVFDDKFLSMPHDEMYESVERQLQQLTHK